MSPVVAPGLAHISLEDPEHMRTLAEQAAEDLADAPAEEVIRWAVDTFGDRICVTSSMTDAVIIHLASAVHPGIDVVFLDTGYHFAETIGTRDAVEAVYPIRLVNVTRHVRWPNRMPSSGRGCSGATPTCAATCARLSRSSGP